MPFLTGFRNWWKPKKNQEMTQIYDTKLVNTVSIGKRVAKDLEEITGISSTKLTKSTDLAQTVEILNQGSSKLDDELANQNAEYDLAIVEFLEVDKDYKDYITLQETLSKTNKNLNNNNDERK